MIARWMIVLGALVVLAVLAGPLAVDTDSLAWAQTAPRLSAEKDKAAQEAQLKAKAKAALEAQQQQKAKAQKEALEAAMAKANAALEAKKKAKAEQEAALRKQFEKATIVAKLKSEQAKAEEKAKAEKARQQAAFDAAKAAYTAKLQHANAKLRELEAARKAQTSAQATLNLAIKTWAKTTGNTAAGYQVAKTVLNPAQAKAAVDAAAAVVKTKEAEYAAAKSILPGAVKAVNDARPK